MKKLDGSKTEANLKAAFAGESKARAGYVRFASKAKEEGHGAAALYFETTAVNEYEHAKIWLKFIGGVEPAAGAVNEQQIKVGSTKDNLQAAINGETFENTEMYPSFAKAAQEEGFDAIARLFEQVSEIEKTHADYFKVLLGRLDSAAAAPASPEKWKCGKCGFLSSEKDAPALCPVCNGTAFGRF